MNDDIDKIICIYIEKAKASLDDAKFLIDNKKYHIAVNRLYYSQFYMISALAMKDNFETSKHTQLLGWFNKNYVAEEKVDIEYGRIIIQLFELRNKADYDIYTTFTKKQTLSLYKKCNIINNKIEEIIYKK